MRLETFLFFFDLELGGTIIGFYHLIVYCLLVIASVISFVVAAIYYCELKIDCTTHPLTNVFLSADEVNLIYLALAIVVGIILLCILIYISWQLVLGVEFVSKLKLPIRISFHSKYFSAITDEFKSSEFFA